MFLSNRKLFFIVITVAVLISLTVSAYTLYNGDGQVLGSFDPLPNVWYIPEGMINYDIKGGVIDDMNFSKDENALILHLDSKQDGYVDVSLPIEFLDSAHLGSYMVFIDNEEVFFGDVDSDIFRINFTSNASTIEILRAMW